MKRKHYESETIAARYRESRWRTVALGMMAANLLLAATVAGTDTTEKIVIVPPVIERPFWVKGAEMSREYLEEMSRYLAGLVLNVTPKSVESGIDIFLRYVAPASYGQIRARMTAQADRLRRDDVSTAFYPVSYQTRPKKRQVVITGDFVTVVGKQIVSKVRRSWRFAYTYTGGRLWIAEFLEVKSEDPFAESDQHTAAGASVSS